MTPSKIRPEFSTSTAERSMCPVCGRGPFLLTKAGKLRHHADYRRDEYRCDGAGQKPKEG